MITFDENNKNDEFSIILTPNRLIGWSILIKFYIFTCGVSLSIVMVFAVLGYWMILPISGVELMVLGVGLYLTCRKIYAQEVIVINEHT